MLLRVLIYAGLLAAPAAGFSGFSGRPSTPVWKLSPRHRVRDRRDTVSMGLFGFNWWKKKEAATTTTGDIQLEKTSPKIMETLTTQVAVVGAGVSGLVCARALADAGKCMNYRRCNSQFLKENILSHAGLDVLLVEASDDVGGRVRTDEVDGFLLDRGFQVSGRRDFSSSFF